MSGVPAPTATTASPPRLADLTGPWAIEPRAGAALFELAKRPDWPTNLTAATGAGAAGRQPPTRGTGGVAVVSLVGPMAKGGFGYGSTSTVRVRQDIQRAVDDPNVTAILLAIDSPGGAVAGTEDLAAEVRAARRTKPVYAHVDDLCASAAYWVASQCEQVWANSAKALVGSIGTLVVLDDSSAAFEKAGVKTLVFHTGPLKGAGTGGASVTAEQQAYFQGLVDSTQQGFDAAVTSGRKLTATQLAAVRTGGVFTADEALRLKLIDGIRPLGATLAALAAASPRTGSMTAAMTGPRPGGNRMDEIVTPQAGTTTPQAGAVSAPPVIIAGSLNPADTPEQAERRRVADIITLTAGNTEVASQAIREGWTALKAENVALKAAIPKSPPTWNPHTAVQYDGYGATGREASGVKTLTAALLVKAGRGAAAEKSLGAEVVGRLGSLRAMSLPELCAASLRMDGRDVPASRGELIRAAVSTGTFPTALGDAARITVEAAYEATPETWRAWCAIRQAADFRPHQTVRPQFFDNLERVAKGGQIAHGTAAFENAIRWKVDTFARQLQIDRQDIVNDDLGVIGEVLPSLARAAKRTLADLVYGGLLANAGPHFSVANKNLITGAGSAFGMTAMTAAVKTMRVQRDADGSTLDIQPAVLLVPPELETPARQLLASVTLARDGSTDQQATANPFSQAVQLVVEPRLSNDKFPGWSATRWFLFAAPVDVPAVVGFLDGQQSPAVETFNLNADINRLAIGMRVYHDFGFGLGDPKAGVSNAGA